MFDLPRVFFWIELGGLLLSLLTLWPSYAAQMLVWRFTPRKKWSDTKVDHNKGRRDEAMTQSTAGGEERSSEGRGQRRRRDRDRDSGPQTHPDRLRRRTRSLTHSLTLRIVPLRCTFSAWAWSAW